MYTTSSRTVSPGLEWLWTSEGWELMDVCWYLGKWILFSTQVRSSFLALLIAQAELALSATQNENPTLSYETGQELTDSGGPFGDGEVFYTLCLITHTLPRLCDRERIAVQRKCHYYKVIMLHEGRFCQRGIVFISLDKFCILLSVLIWTTNLNVIIVLIFIF